MIDVRKKIEDLVMGDNCPELTKWVADKIIEEIIKPIAKEAFEAGENCMRSEYEHLENRGAKAEPDFDDFIELHFKQEKKEKPVITSDGKMFEKAMEAANYCHKNKGVTWNWLSEGVTSNKQ